MLQCFWSGTCVCVCVCVHVRQCFHVNASDRTGYGVSSMCCSVAQNNHSTINPSPMLPELTGRDS